MNPVLLLAQLKSLGVSLVAKDGALYCSDPGKRLTDALRNSMRDQKPALLALLAGREARAESFDAPILPVEARPSYPVSSQQRRMYSMQQFDLGSVAYNVTAAYEIDADVSSIRIQEVVNRIVARHECLRTTFAWRDDELAQVPHGSMDCPVALADVGDADLDTVAASFIRPFDLEAGPLLRVMLARRKSGGAWLLTDMHHAISDGISSAILMGEFARLFAGETLEPVALQYRDYAVWQQEGAGRNLIEGQRAYWKSQFASDAPQLSLPTDYARPAIRESGGATVEAALSAATTLEVKRRCREWEVSPFMLLLACYQTLLARHSAQEDIVVGCPVAGRGRAELDGVMGMFVNTLAIRGRPSFAKRFIDWLQELKQDCLAAFEQQQFPLEELIEELGVERDASRSPLFDTLFVLQNFDRDESVGSLRGMRSAPLKNATAKFDLSLSAREESGRLRFEFEYATSLFASPTARRFARRFVSIVEAVLSEPSARIGDIDLLNAEERRQLLGAFNDTAEPYPGSQRVNALLEERAARLPDAVALRQGDESMTYREVNERANQLARHLVGARNVAPGDIVAMAVERSFEMVIGILAVLKAGAAYLPIDPRTPSARLKYVLEDSRAKLLLVLSRIAPRLETSAPLLAIDDASLYVGDATNLPQAGRAGDLLYVIYTSGSTGRPKGVLIDHKVALNSLSAMERLYPLGNADVYLLKTTYTFDVSISELFGWFFGQGSLAILPPDDEKDPDAIVAAVRRFGVTHINFVPSMLGALLETLDEAGWEAMSRLKYLFLAGEEIGMPLARKLARLQKSVAVENIYGPSETFYTTRFSLGNLGDATRVPIGVPFPNMRMYILNGAGQLNPIGVPGELFVSGDSLARGYLALDELTRERFVENPFEPGQLMYRTGDAARWLEDGNIEYLGRLDQQVKLRGFRIELGEIETVLAACPGAREVVAAIKSVNGEPMLVAYVAAAADFDVSALRDAARAALPAYMAPSRYVVMDAFPQTASGKIDRKALPEPDAGAPDPERAYEAPRDEVERKLCAIWQEVLGIERVGVRDSFFAIGGDSLLAIKMIRLAKREGMSFSLKDFYKNDQIALMRPELDGADAAPAAVYSGPVPLTISQRWYLSENFADPAHNNICVTLPIRAGSLDTEAARAAFFEVAQRHEALRSRVFEADGRWQARVESAARAEDFAYHDLKDVEEAERAARCEAIVEAAKRSIRIDSGGLFKAALIDCGPDRDALVAFVGCHVAVDGPSMGLALEEFREIYRRRVAGDARPLPPVSVNLREAMAATEDYARSDAMAAEREYWEQRPWGEVAPLPIDDPVAWGDNALGRVRQVQFALSEDDTRRLQRWVAEDLKSDMQSALLAAFSIGVRSWAGGGAAMILTIDSGRSFLSHATGQDVSQSVGTFSITTPRVVRMDSAWSAEEVARRVSEQLRRESMGGFGYDVLRYVAGVGGRPGEMPWVSDEEKIILNYLGSYQPQDDSRPDEIFGKESMPTYSVCLDNSLCCAFRCTAVVYGGRLRVSWESNRDAFREETIDRLSRAVQNALSAMGHSRCVTT